MRYCRIIIIFLDINTPTVGSGYIYPMVIIWIF